MIKKIAINP